MDTKYTRTTITIPEDLLFEIKKKALMERKTVKETIMKGLSLYIGKDIPNETSTDILSLYGSWGKGITGSSFLKKTRYGVIEKEREKYLKKIWKKS
jgi:hypothetical protein